MSTCRRPNSGGRAVFEEDAAVAHVAARVTLVYFGGGIAVERERQAQLSGLLAQPRQDGGVAPVAEDQVGIVPREQMLERDRGGLSGFIEFELASVHFDFERSLHTVPGINAFGALQTAEAHAQDFERRRVVVDRPFSVAAFEREDEWPSPSASTSTRASGNTPRCQQYSDASIKSLL